MNKLLGGGLAFGLATVGSLALAGPGSAGVQPLQATISPGSITQGGSVTVTSVDGCLQGEHDPGTIFGEIFFGDEEESFDFFEEDITFEQSHEGQWSEVLTSPADAQVGTYTVLVGCFEDGEEGAFIGDYNELTFTVTAAPVDTTPTPPVEPPPAPPVRRQPNATG